MIRLENTVGICPEKMLQTSYNDLVLMPSERFSTIFFFKYLTEKPSLGRLIHKAQVLGLGTSCRASWERLLPLQQDKQSAH